MSKDKEITDLNLRILKLEAEVNDKDFEIGQIKDDLDNCYSEQMEFENEISELREQLEVSMPVSDANLNRGVSLVDEGKMTLLRDNWHKFSAEQLEVFLSKIKY